MAAKTVDKVVSGVTVWTKMF